MKMLLVPVDFSPAACNAFEYALRVSHPFKSRVTVLYVYQPPMAEPFAEFALQAELYTQEEALARERFERMVHDLPPALVQERQIEFQMEVGFSALEIQRVAQELMPDLIVMGMRGGSPFAKKILGSTTTSLLQRTAAPILVVPEHATYEGLKHIAYATDYEEDDIRVIDEVLYFARKNQARLTCLHVNTAAEEKNTYKQELFRRAYATEIAQDSIAFRTLQDDSVVDGVMDFAQEAHVGMIVMLTHPRTRIGQIFQYSHAREAARVTPVPLWVYPMYEKTPA
ncbi:MAG: universal stress protein [Bacteroidia bacterium]|nr:universal stress protein [Bacteroidia bacterium]